MKPWQKMGFESSGARPAQTLILEHFESMCGTELPLDYREFLLEINGGRPIPHASAVPAPYAVVALHTGEWNTPRPIQEDDKAIVDFLLCAEDWTGMYEEESDTLTVTYGYREFVLERPNFFPLGLIPLAWTPGTSMFLLDVGAEDFGSVWFWDAYWFDATLQAINPHYNIGKVADTFSSFISKISFETLG